MGSSVDEEAILAARRLRDLYPPSSAADAAVAADADLSTAQLAIRDHARNFAINNYSTRAREWDASGSALPRDELARIAGVDLLGLTLPPSVGGLGWPLLDGLIALEEVAKVCQLAAWPIFEACTGAARVIDLLGDEEQKRRFLPAVVRGEAVIALAISEPDAGSAATSLTTVARVEGDELLLRGTKRWCSGAGRADYYLVYCRLSNDSEAAGVGAVVVEAEAAGLSFGAQERLMGFRGIGSADIHLDDVRVSKRNLIASAGSFRQLFEAFSIERLGNATMSLAIAQSALDRTSRYVLSRQQFGRDLADFQLVQAAVADMVMLTSAARLLVHSAARQAGTGTPSALTSSVAKCFANESAKRVSDLAIQLHGGYGYAEEYELERLHRDAHGWAIAGGTANMQRIRIASAYLGRRFDQRQHASGTLATPGTGGNR